MSSRRPRAGSAWLGGVLAEGVVAESDDLTALDQGGWWAVLVTFEGSVRMWRFADTRLRTKPAASGAAWRGPEGHTWTSSLERSAYLDGVQEVRRRIREGEVYQVNLCRVLSAPVADQSPWPLAARLAAGNPAPYAGVIDVPAGPTGGPVRLVSASPELLLARDGDLVSSGPIKGTGATAADLLPKDDAENVMIVDMVRNDLTRVCVPGTVAVPSLLAREQHPGLVHLVSTVSGRLAPGTGWPALLDALLPPASVSGAPRSSALRAIGELEPVARGPYCGAVGFVDADAGTARLAVGIRTFWLDDGRLRFGTGAGITWGSDAEQEWRETELKAARLIRLASAAEPLPTPGTLGRPADTSGSRTTGVQEASA